MIKKNFLMTSFLALALFASCAKGPSSSIVSQPSDSVQADTAVDNGRIVSVEKAIFLANDPSQPNPPLIYSSNLLDFTHESTIQAPTVSAGDSRKLRATSVVKSDNTLFVSYMMEGSDYYASLDIINIANINAPVILSSLKFSNFKFSDVKVKGHYAYLAGAKKTQGASLMVVDIGNLSAPKFVKYYVFPGNIATSIDIREGQMLVSSAKNGGIITFNMDDLSNPKYLQFYTRDNALFVKAMLAANDSSSLVPMVLEGVGSTQITYKGDSLPLSTTKESGAPSRFITMGPMLYAVSAAGLSVSEITNKFNGFLRTSYVQGSPNGIAEMDQKLYIASGEAGLRVWDANEPGNPSEVGYLTFEDLGSANNVWVEKINSTQNLIVLADGVSGIRLVKEEKFLNSSNVSIKVHAKSNQFNGINGKIAVTVNGVQVGAAVDVSSTDFNTYTFESSDLLHFGDVVKVIFFNDDGARNVSVAYVKIGEDYFYPWYNNAFFMNDTRQFQSDSDNILLEDGGYYKFIF